MTTSWQIRAIKAPATGGSPCAHALPTHTSPPTGSKLLWLDANLGTFQNTGLTTPSVNMGAVGGWQDQSGTGFHQTNSDGPTQPTLHQNVQNGLSAVHYDGTNDFLRNSSGPTHIWDSGATVLMALNIASGQAGARTIFCRHTYWYIGLETISAVDARLKLSVDFTGSDGTWRSFDPVITFDNWQILTIQYDANSVVNDAYLARTCSAATTEEASTPSGARRTEVGFGFDTGGRGDNNNIAMHLGELLIYDGILSTADREHGEGYLANKWL